MYVANINFSEIPEIGFAFQHYSKTYKAKYQSKKMCIEIAYISSGTVEIELYGKKETAGSGDVIVLFRHLPVSIRTTGEASHSHCSVLAEFENYDFSFNEDFTDGLTVPFVTKHCDKTEKIGKILNRIATNMALDREKNALISSVAFLSVLGTISDIYQAQNQGVSRAYKNITSSVYKYVEENIESKIRLTDIAGFIGKSPNHTAHAFKVSTGMTVSQYISNQKANKIAYMIKNEGVTFKEACSRMCLSDEAYGYRIFKKYTGVTPKEFLISQKITKNI